MKLKYPYRAFVCYSHEDREIAECVVTALKQTGLVAILDEKLSCGLDYSREIQEFIESAHLFIPIITENALKQPWVNQEIGFAHALNVPVLPVGVGVDPKGLIQHLQAVSAQRDLDDLTERLAKVDFEKIVRPAAKAHRILVEIATDAIDRPRMMVRYAEKVLAATGREGDGTVRQRAYYTSFSLPDENVSQPIWQEREYGQPRTRDYLEAQRRERQVMEKLARRYGCRLMVDPRRERFPGSPIGWRARFKVLRDVISDETIKNLEVMPAKLEEPHNLVIVGDRFLAEADSRLAGQGYLRTQFTWHAPTILDRTLLFDEEFADLCRAAGIRPKDSRRYMKQILEELFAAEGPWGAGTPA